MNVDFFLRNEKYIKWDFYLSAVIPHLENANCKQRQKLQKYTSRKQIPAVSFQINARNAYYII